MISVHRHCRFGTIAALLALAVVLLMHECLSVSATENESCVRGVKPGNEGLFTGAEFVCDEGLTRLGEGSVNDDYCDCADGTDEPGTSACSGVGSGLFHCRNELSLALEISSSLVDDGVCDCCDGSDEPQNMCINTCFEDGLEMRKKAEEHTRLTQAGLIKRQNLIDSAFTEMQTQHTKLNEIKARLRISEEKEKLTVTGVDSSSVLEPLPIHTLRLSELDASQLRELLVEFAEKSTQRELLVNLVKTFLNMKKRNNEEVELDASSDDVLSQELDPFWPNDEKVEKKSELDLIRSEMKEVETVLAGDYGKKFEWFTRRSKCFEIRVGKYMYEACMYANARQDSTSLGNWEGFSEDRMALKWTGGQKCWKADSRSLTLQLECGTTEAILDMNEPETCVYVGRFSTPVACK